MFSLCAVQKKILDTLCVLEDQGSSDSLGEELHDVKFLVLDNDSEIKGDNISLILPVQLDQYFSLYLAAAVVVHKLTYRSTVGVQVCPPLYSTGITFSIFLYSVNFLCYVQIFFVRIFVSLKLAE